MREWGPILLWTEKHYWVWAVITLGPALLPCLGQDSPFL
jgi:hypothetical protein